MTVAASVFVCIALALLIFAALHDVATRTVPNWVSVGIAVCGLARLLLTRDIGWGLALALLVFTGAVGLWRFGFMGGADAKLLGATALIASPGLVASLLLVIALSGGVLALCYLVLSRFVHRPPPGRRRTILSRLAKAECWRLSRRGPLPYATAIAAGSVLTLSPQIWG